MSWPFTDWHRLAVRQLHLPPGEFWTMPLADWLALLRPDTAPLDTDALRKLMEDYPDG